MEAATLKFLQRELEQNRPFSVECGPVSYFNQPRAGSIPAMPPVDPFRKPAVYEWQHEHRIVIRPYEAEDFLDVELPGLCDLLRIVR